MKKKKPDKRFLHKYFKKRKLLVKQSQILMLARKTALYSKYHAVLGDYGNSYASILKRNYYGLRLEYRNNEDVTTALIFYF